MDDVHKQLSSLKVQSFKQFCGQQQALPFVQIPVTALLHMTEEGKGGHWQMKGARPLTEI